MSDIFDPKMLERLVAASNPPAIVRSADSYQDPANPDWQGPIGKEKKANKWATISAVAGPLADGLSTQWAMNQSGPNVQIAEGNPIFGKNPSGGKILGIKALQAAISGLLTHYGGKTHPESANVFGFGTGAINGTAAAFNIKNGLHAKELNKGSK